MYLERNGKNVKLVIENGTPAVFEGSKRQEISREEAELLLIGYLQVLKTRSLAEIAQADEGHKLQCIYAHYSQRSADINNLVRMLEYGEESTEEHPTEVKIEFIEQPEVKTGQAGFNNMVLRTPKKVARTRIKSVQAGSEYQI